MLASVFWPGSFIRVVVASTNLVIAKVDLSNVEAIQQLAEQGIDVARILPTLLGIGAIPFIVHPIDTTVDKAGELSFSKALKGEMKDAKDIATGVGVMGGCLALPPTLFHVAEKINDMVDIIANNNQL